MITKKSGVFAAMAIVFLLTATLMASCVDPIGPGGLQVPNKGDDYEPPAGKSYIRLNFGSSNGRTIMPPTTMNAQSFAAFTVLIVNAGNPSDKPDDGTTGYTYSALTAKNFTVTTGATYNVTVNAYMAAYTGTGDVIAASGTASTSAISATTNNVPITLEAKYDGTSIGTFSWTLTYGSPGGAFTSLTTATMDIEKLDGSAGGTQENLKTTASGTQDINSGIYRVVVTLNGGATLQNDIQTFILHVYNAMTSSWTHNFSALNNISYTVTFTNVNGSGNTSTNPVPAYTHGQLLNASPYPYATPPTHSDPGYTFGGWYTSDGSGNNWAGLTPVDPTKYLIFKTQSLYARWNNTASPPQADITVDFTLEDDGDTLTISSTAPTISQADLLGGTTLILTVTDALPSGTIYSWKFNGKEVSATDTFIIGFDPEDSDTFEYIVVGTHAFSVEVTTDKTYSKDFNFEVTSP